MRNHLKSGVVESVPMPPYVGSRKETEKKGFFFDEEGRQALRVTFIE